MVLMVLEMILMVLGEVLVVLGVILVVLGGSRLSFLTKGFFRRAIAIMPSPTTLLLQKPSFVP